MTKPFDTTLKELFDVYPNDLLRLLRLPINEPLQALPTNLTANIDTDHVLGWGSPLRAVVDLNFQVEWDDETPFRILCYNALLYREHRVPVHSIVIMLRSRGNDMRMNEGIQYAVFPERGSMSFHPEIIRMWERPVEEMLTGGLGLLPLATVAATPDGVTREDALPEILKRIEERLAREPSSEKTNRLLNWTYTLAGLNYTYAFADAIFRRSSTMWSDILKHSSTHQGTLQEGRIDGVRKVMLELGASKLGPPNETVRANLASITDLDRLNRLTLAMLKATTWDEILRIE